MSNSDELQNNIGYFFNDVSILNIALTHPSYANEHNINKCYTNQRLEFLGDAILEFVSSDFLYNYYNNNDEGFLTKTRATLVCENTLSDIAIKLKLYKYLMFGHGENTDTIMNNKSIMCDTLEALIGAIYIDGGINPTRCFISNYILNDYNLHRISSDYKSVIQEIANQNKISLRYELIDEFGPDHNKSFVIKLHYGNSYFCEGCGKSKKDAEQDAARQMIKLIK